MTESPTSGIRLDKWLWAARFYKTRSLAKQAIEGGKVQYNGDRCKVSKEVQVGAKLSLRVGLDTKVVTIIALSDQRRGAPEAALLYEETADSIAQREQQAADRKALGSAFAHPERPNKKQRRQIHRFQRITE
ncbi:MAG: ribosome-associated heat shock protein Hsp15 [Gammaproteobacteria bacterium]|jgi:ribosome-associated heat shock protein Hsp15|nr:ribosome-associated heat shock protein Hsp15 [Zhongshania sp.]MBU0536808.1 ribosome-associated heat shock protein Hsp15 [Gammaproteobacteria bacterium]MBU1831406.1 ribosome-associated heat shock protein Hsp15 [Gammaproteobacteria bacterium]